MSGITALSLNPIPGNGSYQMERVDFNLAALLSLATGTYWLELHDGSSLTSIANPNAANVFWAIVSENAAGNAMQSGISSPPSGNTGNALAL